MPRARELQARQKASSWRTASGASGAPWTVDRAGPNADSPAAPCKSGALAVPLVPLCGGVRAAHAPPDGWGALADASGGGAGLAPPQRRRQRPQLASDPVDEQVDGEVRAGVGRGEQGAHV